MNASPIACALGLVAFLTAGAAEAAQSAASAAAKGRVTPLSVQVTDPAIPPAVRKGLTGKVGAIVDRALATPALADPRGFSIRRSMSIHAPQEGFPGRQPARAEGVLIPQEIDLESGAKPDAAGAYMGRLEGPTFRIFVNDLLALYANSNGGADASQTVQHLPQQVASIQGFPVFRVGIRNVVLVTKPGRLPWTYVTKGEHLQALVDDTRATIAGMEGPIHPRLQATLDDQVRQLASLGPQDRAAPACVSSRLSQAFGDCAAKGATHYVRPNPAYFDPGASRDAVQLVMVGAPAEGGNGHPRLEPRLRAAAAALDYRAIQAALD